MLKLIPARSMHALVVLMHYLVPAGWQHVIPDITNGGVKGCGWPKGMQGWSWCAWPAALRAAGVGLDGAQVGAAALAQM